MQEVTSSTSSTSLTAPSTMTKTYLESNTSSSSPAPQKKICCACPNTKRLRDDCVVSHGEEACGKWIDAHKRCLRSEGFKV